MNFDLKPSSGILTQVGKANGEAYQAYSATWSNADKSEHEAAFAPARSGNKADGFVTGESYFKSVVIALEGAQQSIFIAGWQINWDVQLVPGKRLIDVLKSALDKSLNLHIYVMPWMSPKLGIDTGDLGTMLAIFQLNAGREKMRAFCCPAGLQNDFKAIEATFFSHHQKQVVIDNKIAFVGGIDLAYGRRDTEKFDLNHGWRKGPERYNTCAPALHELQAGEVAHYLSTTELLETALTIGALFDTSGAKKSMTQSAWDSRLGKTVDQGIMDGKNWLKENHIPEWMKIPLRPIVREVREEIDLLQTHVIENVMDQLQRGALKPEYVTVAVGMAASTMKKCYLALLGSAWASQKPNTELFTPGVQALPLSDSVLADDQARMPWQDVHMRIEGPSVFDLSMNFIRRWNSLQKRYLPSVILQKRVMIPSSLHPANPGRTPPKAGNVEVRVLRSASLSLQQQENAAMGGKLPKSKQHEIHDMMVEIILGAEKFVYIENQFFQTGFGVPSVAADDDENASAPIKYLMSQAGNRISAAITVAGATHAKIMPNNRIGEALANRIEMAIRQGGIFHVYIVLPVHPEGSLSDIAIIGQIHWTMQSLVFASHSLVNRIRIALAAAKEVPNKFERLKAGAWEAAKRKVASRTADDGDAPYESITESEWREHLTLLNLRNADIIKGKVRTEQIYVHSKLLIADDRTVIMGSANINDRSLAGERDSELAVWVNDNTKVNGVLLDGVKGTEVRFFAQDLRMRLWKKHFALEGANSIVKAASSLEAMIDKPADPKTWRAIQKIADTNLATYSVVFPFIPRNGGEKTWIPIWPTCPPKKGKNVKPINFARSYENTMPFSEEFWKTAYPAPKGIKGFFTSLPTQWTAGENNHPAMNMILLTQGVPEAPYPPEMAPQPSSKTLMTKVEINEDTENITG